MTNITVGFIGSGNMAEALIKGLVGKGVLAPDHIYCADINPGRLETLRQSYQIQPVSGNLELAERASLLILAVKPQQAREVLTQLAPALDPERHVLISIAAGLTTAYLETCLQKPMKIVRVMPNTPARIQAAASAYCLGAHATGHEGQVTADLFRAVGLVLPVEESLMDAVTALSGSGPAYVFYLCEVLIQSALTLGLGKQQARALAVETIWGAAQLLKQGDQSPEALRKAVTSPGGTTEAALAVLEQRRLPAIFKEALTAARDRGRVLSAGQKEK